MSRFMSAGIPTGAPPGWIAPYGWTMTSNTPTPQTREADLRALANLKIAMIIALVSTALGFLVPEIASASGYSLFSIPAAGSSTPIRLSHVFVYAILGSALAGIVLTLVSLYFVRSGFVQLRPIDLRFQSSPTWVLLAMIGLVLVGVGLVLLLGAIVQFLQCVGTASTVPSSCAPTFGLFLGGVAALLLGAIILLIGGIGTVVGVWRLGDRYDNGLFKAGAILFIFFPIVGAILVLIATVGAEGKLRNPPAVQYTPATAWTPPPTPPPPPPHG